MAQLEAVFIDQREDRADGVHPTVALNATMAVMGKNTPVPISQT